MSELKLKQRSFVFEVKTVNHRFCEVNLRLPPKFYPLEPELLEFTRNHFSRGRIDLFIRENNASRSSKEPVRLNEEQLETYYKTLSRLNQKLKCSEPIRLENLVNLPQVIVVESEELELKDVLEVLKKGLLQSFEKVEKVREKEGKALKKDFEMRLTTLVEYASKVEQAVPKMVDSYRQRLHERIQKLLQQPSDEWKLAQEIAYYVDRSDISEEIQRFTNHIQHFKNVLKETQPIGRKLDFVLQEMNREINTLGAKTQNFEVSKWVVESKHELEKMREQVQNVE